MKPESCTAVLFDLDGTLIDSAPDLLAALNRVRYELGLPPAPAEPNLRAQVSRGAAGLIAIGLPELDERAQQAARNQLLDYYAEHPWVHSTVFDGVNELLETLAERGLKLGIVTNKISRFAKPVVAASGLAKHFGSLIAGDQVTRPKPDPEPVLAACRELGVDPKATLFLGDDRRDVQSGQSAGSLTWVAAWGYLPSGCSPHDWGADGVADQPLDLLQAIAAGPLATSQA